MELQGILLKEISEPQQKLAYNPVREPSSSFLDLLTGQISTLKESRNREIDYPDRHRNEIRENNENLNSRTDENAAASKDKNTDYMNRAPEKSETPEKEVTAANKKPVEEITEGKNTEKTEKNRKPGKHTETEKKPGPDDTDIDLKKLMEERLKFIERDGKTVKGDSPKGGETEIDMEGLFRGINRLIDILNKQDLKPELKKEIESTRQMLEDLMRDRGGKKDLARLIKLVETLETLAEKKSAETGRGEPEDNKTRLLLQSLKKKIADAVEKRAHVTAEKETDNRQAAAPVQNRPAPEKIESLLSQVRPEGSEGKKGDQHQGNQNSQGMGMQFGKQGAEARAQAAAALQGRSQAFREHLDNIVQNARVVVKDGRNGTMTLKLYPRELGTVNVNLGLEQGVIHGRFLVDNQEAKSLLMDNLSHIRDQLMEAGISVGEFHVDVNDPRSQMSSEENDTPVYAVPGSITEAQAEFEYNEVPTHQGSINVII